MTPEAFREQGLKVAHCDGFKHCSPLPHKHATLEKGVEYCAVGKCVIVDSVEFVGVLAKQIPPPLMVKATDAIMGSFEIAFPGWELREVIFV